MRRKHLRMTPGCAALLNMETQDEKLLQVIIFAQPSLDERLCAIDYESLCQRISLSVTIGHISQGAR